MSLLASDLLLPTYFLLLTSYFLLPTYFLLLTSYFLLLTSYFLLLTSCFLLLTSYFLLLTSYFLLLATSSTSGDARRTESRRRATAEREHRYGLTMLALGQIAMIGTRRNAPNLRKLRGLVDHGT